MAPGGDTGRVTQHRWQLTVDTSYSIRGRGTVVVGHLTGTPGNGEHSVLETADGRSRPVVVLGVDGSRARGADGVGILVNATDVHPVPHGAVLRAAS